MDRDKLLGIARIILIVLIIIMIPVVIYQGYLYKVQLDYQNDIPDVSEAEMDEKVEKELKEIEEDIKEIKDPRVRKARIEQVRERKKFKKSKNQNILRLIIPSLNINTEVVNGTTDSALKYGPGLYSVAQMPGEGDRNTSIAGHRNGIGSSWNIFYSIDKLKDGDEFYLAYKDKVYQYIYEETKIVSPDTLSVLDARGYSCLTLTSCHPIGSDKERIIVHAKLNKVIDRKNTNY